VGFDSVYSGLRVIDLSQGVAGPYCASMLAQHGAEVIKIEPLEGDWSRGLGQLNGGHGAYSVGTNLGKRSISVDLKSETGRGIVERMLDGADVFIEGFRPGVIDRLGFSWQRLSEKDPELIYLSISGFGQTGPLSTKPAMDPVLQAFVGTMDENKGTDGIPHRSPVVFFDMATGLYALHSVAAALHLRRDGLGGRRVMVSLMEAAANITTIRLQSSYMFGPYKPASAPSGIFETKDGWIQMTVVKQHEFIKACKALGLDDIAADPRYHNTAARGQNHATLNAAAAEVFKQKTSREWRDILTEGDVQNEIVQTYPEFIAHPHTKETELISWLPQGETGDAWPIPNLPNVPRLKPGDAKAVAPLKGQHTRELLVQFGYGEAEIAELFANGVVVEA
jgi:crotonobetainyl-CoA:carnitine CoA-transferase CaiB-like acyl-CoA transferase